MNKVIKESTYLKGGRLDDGIPAGTRTRAATTTPATVTPSSVIRAIITRTGKADGHRNSQREEELESQLARGRGTSVATSKGKRNQCCSS